MRLVAISGGRPQACTSISRRRVKRRTNQYPARKASAIITNMPVAFQAPESPTSRGASPYSSNTLLTGMSARPGKMPVSTQPTARMPMGTRMTLGASCTSSRSGAGWPRKAACRNLAI